MKNRVSNKKTYSIFEWDDEYVCNNFTNTNPDFQGVEVRLDNKLLGTILGVSIPDGSNNIDVNTFEDTVINWVIDND